MTETIDDTGAGLRGPDGHVGDLKLRRLFAGETLGGEHQAVAAHAASCVDCARRLAALSEEQRSFEARISFDRFAAGVERAVRVPAPAAPTGTRHWWGRPASTRSFVTVMSVASLAAAVVLVAGVRPLFENARLRHVHTAERTAENERLSATNRIKGASVSAGVTVRVAGSGDQGRQRTAASDRPEPLTIGERIRVGVQPGSHGFLFAISIDDAGVVTPLYPEGGSSLALARGGRLQYLPDSLELTGKGSERLVVLLTDAPLEADTVRRAAQAAFRQAGGDLGKLPDLAVKGEQFHRLFLKP